MPERQYNKEGQPNWPQNGCGSFPAWLLLGLTPCEHSGMAEVWACWVAVALAQPLSFCVLFLQGLH